MYGLMDHYSTVLNNVGKLQKMLVQDNSLAVDKRWQDLVMENFDFFDELYRILSTIDPPDGYAEHHEEMTKALMYISMAREPLIEGAVTEDAELMNKVMDLIILSNKHREKASKMLE